MLCMRSKHKQTRATVSEQCNSNSTQTVRKFLVNLATVYVTNVLAQSPIQQSVPT